MKKTKRNLEGLQKRLSVLRTTVRDLDPKELGEVKGGMMAMAREACCPCYSHVWTN